MVPPSFDRKEYAEWKDHLGGHLSSYQNAAKELECSLPLLVLIDMACGVWNVVGSLQRDSDDGDDWKKGSEHE